MHAPEEVGEGGKVILVDEEDKMKIIGEAKELSEEHIQLIKKSYETIKSAFGVENGVIAMAFRIGYADKSSARCSRKPPEIVFDRSN